LPFERLRRQLLVLDHLPRRGVRRRAYHDLCRRGRLLQPRRGVHRVAGHDAVALARRPLPVGEHLAGLDADAQLQLRTTFRGELRAKLRHGLLHLEGGADGALGIVLVDGRHAEDSQHRVAGELLDEALVALDLRAEPIERAADDRLDDLGVVALVQAGVADEIGEHERRDLALAV
jgi:hypothetical protein